MKTLKVITHPQDPRRRLLVQQRDDGLFTFTYENRHVDIDEEFDVPGGIYETAEAAEHNARCQIRWLRN